MVLLQGSFFEYYDHTIKQGPEVEQAMAKDGLVVVEGKRREPWSSRQTCRQLVAQSRSAKDVVEEATGRDRLAGGHQNGETRRVDGVTGRQRVLQADT